jgi:hypothetical protein
LKKSDILPLTLIQTLNLNLTLTLTLTLTLLDLNTARTSLMTLATLTGGDLEVTNDGEILYSFPKDVRSILQQRSAGQKIKTAYGTLSPYLMFALRTSFGLALFTSLAIIVG